MKIYGIGTDIVNITRLKKAIKKYNHNFKLKIFSQTEILYCENKKDPFPSYAKRFAAKEALTKALGTGFGNGISLKNIEVINEKNGKPKIRLTGAALKKLKKKINNRPYKVYLSLSDDKPWAQATVLISYK